MISNWISLQEPPDPLIKISVAIIIDAALRIEAAAGEVEGVADGG